MIVAYKYVPNESRDREFEGQWVICGPLQDEKALGPLPDGEYAVYEPSKGTVEDERDLLEQLPKTFTYKHRVTNYNEPTPEAKIKVLK